MNIDRIRSRLEAAGYIVVLWHSDDVKELRPDLTDEQCREVLQQCERRHDATIGINWEVLSIFADQLFPEEYEEAGK